MRNDQTSDNLTRFRLVVQIDRTIASDCFVVIGEASDRFKKHMEKVWIHWDHGSGCKFGYRVLILPTSSKTAVTFVVVRNSVPCFMYPSPTV